MTVRPGEASKMGTRRAAPVPSVKGPRAALGHSTRSHTALMESRSNEIQWWSCALGQSALPSLIWRRWWMPSCPASKVSKSPNESPYRAWQSMQTLESGEVNRSGAGSLDRRGSMAAAVSYRRLRKTPVPSPSHDAYRLRAFPTFEGVCDHRILFIARGLAVLIVWHTIDLRCISD